jgi:hypothetical protein
MLPQWSLMAHTIHSDSSFANAIGYLELSDNLSIYHTFKLTEEQTQYLDHFEKMLITPILRRLSILREEPPKYVSQTQTLWNLSSFDISDFYIVYGRDLPPPISDPFIRKYNEFVKLYN